MADTNPLMADARQRIAMMMMQQGVDTTPIQSWTQGAARIANALTGGMMLHQQREDNKAALSNLINSVTPDQPPIAAAPGAAPASDAGPYAAPISSIESQGKYDATGPVTKTGDQAFGKYQVMGSNIGPWTQEILGKPLSPQEFLANPQAQDQVFKAKFGEYVQKYGPEGASKAWFAGPVGMNNPNAMDQLGTTVNGYADKFMTALNPGGAPTAPPNANPAALPPNAAPAGPAPGPANPLPPEAAPPNMKPILAPPGRAQPTLPPNMRGAILTAINSDSPAAQALGIQLLSKYVQPQSYGFQTLPDGTIVRTSATTGAVEPVFQSSKPQFVPNATHDRYGNPQGAFVDPTTQKVTVIGPTGKPIDQASNAPAGTLSDLHGEEYLKTLDPAKQQIVKQIAEGRAPYPSGFMLKTPFGQWLVSALGQYDPQMTGQDYATKLATMKAFDVGGEGKALKSVNQAILHAQQLEPLIDKLGNYSTLPAVANPAHQLFASQTDPEYQNNRAQFQNTVNALASELTKAFRGNSGAIQDVEHWRATMSDQASPDTLKGGLRSSMKLLGGAIDSLGSQYNKGTRSNKEPLDLVDPKNKAIYQKLLGEPADASQGGDVLSQARAAIAAGADRNAVIERLKQNKIDPAGL